MSLGLISDVSVVLGLLNVHDGPDRVQALLVRLKDFVLMLALEDFRRYWLRSMHI